jgi:hypothetical protein
MPTMTVFRCADAFTLSSFGYAACQEASSVTVLRKRPRQKLKTSS